MTFLWERLAQAEAAPVKTLSARRIAEAAVAVADAEGLDAITMRRLAAELGVAPMAAYRHVANKDEVLELMVDLAYSEIDLPADTGWRATLRELAFAVRELILRHPWLTRLAAASMAYELTPHRMALTERALTVLHDDLGLDFDAAMTAGRAVFAYALGATGAELGLRELMDDNGWATGAEARAGLAAQMSWLLATGRYPTFQRYVHEAARKDDLRWQFETGLDHVLHGIVR
ncbi:TetR/AcrR family transcriptional regulator C-terminal domain-containing protein [Nocardia neocaledoniensis]|uniref:TetR/AcrR family transcriptional regulator C-terminal domain-containing protein n=1 Tax=Nocardia neocaledoniensis TaxID=236511 RepID=UPI0024542386|nr:TetR/AcrR family transcriptional regulator C-terminal domain-containing protein [Nocardia neocaledoniensis]